MTIDSRKKEMDGLPEPAVIAAAVVENLEAALEQFRGVSAELSLS